MALSTRVEQLIDECFVGERVRDCDSCPAARWKTGGTCCFGDPEKRDEDSDVCQECLHYDECGVEVDEVLAEERKVYRPRKAKPPSRFSVNRSRPREHLVQIKRGGSKPIRVRKPSHPQPRDKAPRTVPASPPLQQVVRSEQPLVQRWFKDTVWGGLHGMSEASAWFFENYYWE